MDPKKPGKPCARCGCAWAAHKTGTGRACASYRGTWKPPKRKHVKTGIERVMDLKGDE